jgi:tetratricopeptide (TPR) repeat protein
VKKLYPVSIFCTFVFFISAPQPFHSIAAEKKNNKLEKSTTAAVNSDWSHYSWGVFYKNAACRERDVSAREAYLKKAIQNLKEAEASGKSLDKLYLQLAECFILRNDFSSALEYAQKSLAIDNTKVRPYNKIFSIYMKMRNHKAAANILEQCLIVLPDSVHIQYLLAEHYYKNMNDTGRAVSAFNKVITLSDRLPVEDYYKEQSYLNLGNIAYRKAELERAVSMYREVLNINKDNMEAVYYLAITHMESYNLPEAGKYSHMFLKKYPDNRVINSILGRIHYIRDDIRALTFLNRAKGTRYMSGLLAQGLYSELIRNDQTAEKHLDAVKKLAPKAITIYMAMARINARKKDTNAAFNDYVTAGILMYNNRLYEEARRSFNEAFAINGTVPGVYYYMGKVNEETHHYSLALYYYKEANRLHPDTDLMLHIGYLYGIKKDYESAAGYFNDAAARDPNNSRPYFFKALMSIWQEDYPAAEKLMQRAISLDEKSETYYFYMAVVMDKMSKLDLAVSSLEKAIKYNPKSARAYNYLGYLYADNNLKIDESLGLIQKALEIEPGNGAYTDSLGWAYYRKGNYKLALEKLLSAEEILRKANSPDPVVYDHIGDAYLKLGNVENALKYWNISNDIKKNTATESKIKNYQNNQNK